MSESVSDFQTQIASIMDVLMKVAVKEITKLFEGRSIAPERSKAKTVENPWRNSIFLSDVRADMENALTHSEDKYVCSVGVQVGDEWLSHEKQGSTVSQPNPHPQTPCSSHQCCPKEGGRATRQEPAIEEAMASTDGNLREEALEAVDLHCTVDLPCTVLKDRDVESGNIQANNLSGKQQSDQPGATDETMELDSLFDSLKKSLAWPDSHQSDSISEAPCSKKEQPVQSEGHLADEKAAQLANSRPEAPTTTTTTSTSQLSPGRVSTNSSHSASHSTTPVEASEPPPLLRNKTVRFQLGVNHQDWKLLQPCTVKLVNVRLLAGPGRQNAGPKGFPRPKDLRTHQGLHTGRRLCCFTECGNGVWRLQRVLSSSAGSPLACKICGKNFKRRKMLRRHERFHTGEQPYACSLCSKAFTLRKSLRRHLRFHTGERPHGCPHCGRCFRLKDNLKTHLRFHTGERPYACTLCPKSYRVHKNLERHRLTH